MENGHMLVAEEKTKDGIYLSEEQASLTGSKVVVNVNKYDEPSIRLATKLVRTTAMLCAWICMGLFSEITGPTLPSLRQRVNINYEQVSRAMVARSVGFLFASLLGGVLCERYRRFVDVWIALALLLAAVATACVPWCHSLPLLAAAMCLDGAGKGVIATVGNSFVIRLWRTKADMPVQSLHFAFGVGALLAPQITRPFLVAMPTTYAPNATYFQPSNQSSSLNMTLARMNSTAMSAIEYPYSIVSSLTAIMAVVFVVLYFISPMPTSGATSSRSGLRDLVTPHRWLPRKERRFLGLVIILFLFLLFTLPIGAERSFGRFLFAFSTEGANRLSQATGTILETVFWTSFTIGRGMATALAKCVPAAWLLSAELAVAVTSASALAILGEHQPEVLWAGTALFGASLAPLFPTAVMWAHNYIDMSGMMTSVAFVAAGTGAFVFSWVAGYVFQYVGPSSVLILAVFFAVMSSIIFAVLRLLAVCYGPRVQQETNMKDVDIKMSPVEKDASVI